MWKNLNNFQQSFFFLEDKLKSQGIQLFVKNQTFIHKINLDQQIS